MTIIMRLPEVKARTGLCRTAIYSAIQAGTFPQQISLGTPRAIGWDSDEIDAWIKKTIARGKRLNSQTG